MKFEFVRFFYILFPLFFVLGATSCSGQAPRSVYQNPVDPEFPILASCTMGYALASPEAYRDIEDMGCNLSICPFSYPRDIRVHTSSASCTKLKLIMQTYELENVNSENLAELAKHDNIIGYRIMDEPSMADFKTLTAIDKAYECLPNNKLSYSNLFPIYASEKQLGSSNYKRYVKEYIQSNHPSIISFDNYPVLEKGLMDDYYQNLEIIKHYSQKYKIPFWGYALTSQFNTQSYPTRSTVSFQVYSNIAYGAQGIAYYPYRQNKSETIAPVTSTLQKTSLYYVIRDFNKEFYFYSQYFLNSTIKGVWHLGGKIPKCTNKYYRHRNLPKLKTDSEVGFVISSFEKNGHYYLLILNKDYQNEQNIILSTVSQMMNINYISVGKTFVSGTYTLTVPAGEILLFELNNK